MKILKFVYKSFLTGMPFITYNPITNIPFHATFDVMPESLYINYKLNNLQYETINKYINSQNPDFTMLNTEISKHYQTGAGISFFYIILYNIILYQRMSIGGSLL